MSAGTSSHCGPSPSHSLLSVYIPELGLFTASHSTCEEIVPGPVSFTLRDLV